MPKGLPRSGMSQIADLFSCARLPPRKLRHDEVPDYSSLVSEGLGIN